VKPRTKVLPPPTAEERALAAVAAAALRRWWAEPFSAGSPVTAHVDLTRPRRGEWWVTWPGLPGFVHVRGVGYRHALLPGWVYSHSEIASEMVPDLQALADRGERPTVATR